MNNKDELFPIMTENYIKDVDNEILQDLVELQEDPEAFKKKAAEVIASLDERSRSLVKKVSEGDNLITLEQLEILAKIVKPKEANWLFAPTDEELKILKLIRNAGSAGITQSEFINNFIPEESEEDNVLVEQGVMRRLTPLECERLQTLPDLYTESISDTQRYKCIGNGWTVDVIAHILKGMLTDAN